MRAIVFDTQALLMLYLGEPGSDKVEDYLRRVMEKKVGGYLNLVNLTELYYILHRVDKGVAEEKQRNLRGYGVKIVPVTHKSRIWKDAALIKSGHTLSLADAFAASTAISYDATLLTGSGVEFEHIKNLKLERVA